MWNDRVLIEKKKQQMNFYVFARWWVRPNRINGIFPLAVFTNQQHILCVVSSRHQTMGIQNMNCANCLFVKLLEVHKNTPTDNNNGWWKYFFIICIHKSCGVNVSCGELSTFTLNYKVQRSFQAYLERQKVFLCSFDILAYFNRT